MSLPKLNLKKHHCTRYLVEYEHRLPGEALRDLPAAGIIDLAEDDPFGVYAMNYKASNTQHAMLYLVHFHRSSKRAKRTLMVNRFEYRPKGLKTKGQVITEVKFAELFAFLQDRSLEKTGSADAHFSFPVSAFAPVIDLPYSMGGIIAEKRVKIHGLDLALEANGQPYRQMIAVEAESIEQHVAIPDMTGQLSMDCIRSVLDKMASHAGELVHKKRGGKGDKPK